MPLGPDTFAVNYSRFAGPTDAAYRPPSFGQQTTGVPQVSPSMPPFLGGQASSSGGAITEGVGGYGTAGNNNLVTTLANQHPHNMRVSPVWWAVGGLVLGLAVLQGTAWRRTIDERASGGVAVGPVRGSASEEASA